MQAWLSVTPFKNKGLILCLLGINGAENAGKRKQEFRELLCGRDVHSEAME